MKNLFVFIFCLIAGLAVFLRNSFKEAQGLSKVSSSEKLIVSNNNLPLPTTSQAQQNHISKKIIKNSVEYKFDGGIPKGLSPNAENVRKVVLTTFEDREVYNDFLNQYDSWNSEDATSDEILFLIEVMFANSDFDRAEGLLNDFIDRKNLNTLPKVLVLSDFIYRFSNKYDDLNTKEIRNIFLERAIFILENEIKLLEFQSNNDLVQKYQAKLIEIEEALK